MKTRSFGFRIIFTSLLMGAMLLVSPKQTLAATCEWTSENGQPTFSVSGLTENQLNSSIAKFSCTANCSNNLIMNAANILFLAKENVALKNINHEKKSDGTFTASVSPGELDESVIDSANVCIENNLREKMKIWKECTGAKIILNVAAPFTTIANISCYTNANRDEIDRAVYDAKSKCYPQIHTEVYGMSGSDPKKLCETGTEYQIINTSEEADPSEALQGINADSKVTDDVFDSFNPLKVTNSMKTFDLSTPGGILSQLLQFAFPIAGLILFAMLVIGGFQMMTGAASKKSLDAGKQRVMAALMGFLLLFASYWIAQIIQALLKIKIVN